MHAAENGLLTEGEKYAICKAAFEVYGPLGYAVGNHSSHLTEAVERVLAHRPDVARCRCLEVQAAAENETAPTSIRIPLNRKENGGGAPGDARLNEGTEHIDVPIVIDPDLGPLGEAGFTYDHTRVIRLREWNEQVLLHEILHVVLDPVITLGAPEDPYGHNIIARVEVALWESGWRLTRATPPASTPEEPS